MWIYILVGIICLLLGAVGGFFYRKTIHDELFEKEPTYQ